MLWLTIALMTALVIALFAGHGAHERRIEVLEKEAWKRSLEANVIRAVQRAHKMRTKSGVIVLH